MQLNHHSAFFEDVLYHTAYLFVNFPHHVKLYVGREDWLLGRRASERRLNLLAGREGGRIWV